MLERQFHAAKRARGFRVAGEEVGPAAAAGGSALEHGGAEAMPRVTLPTSDDAKHGHSPLFGDASHFTSPMPSEFPPPESDGLAPDAGASFSASCPGSNSRRRSLILWSRGAARRRRRR